MSSWPDLGKRRRRTSVWGCACRRAAGGNCSKNHLNNSAGNCPPCTRPPEMIPQSASLPRPLRDVSLFVWPEAKWASRTQRQSGEGTGQDLLPHQVKYIEDRFASCSPVVSCPFHSVIQALERPLPSNVGMQVIALRRNSGLTREFLDFN